MNLIPSSISGFLKFLASCFTKKISWGCITFRMEDGKEDVNHLTGINDYWEDNNVASSCIKTEKAVTASPIVEHLSSFS